MTFEQAGADAFDALAKLEWLLLHAKASDFARIDMEREVPLAVEQVRRALRVNTESAKMTTEILVAAETARCAKVAQIFADTCDGEDAARDTRLVAMSISKRILEQR